MPSKMCILTYARYTAVMNTTTKAQNTTNFPNPVGKLQIKTSQSFLWHSKCDGILLTCIELLKLNQFTHFPQCIVHIS